MSAHDLKVETARRVGKVREEYAQALIENATMTESLMRVHQGVIKGLNMALEAMEESSKRIGEF